MKMGYIMGSKWNIKYIVHTYYVWYLCMVWYGMVWMGGDDSLGPLHPKRKRKRKRKHHLSPLPPPYGKYHRRFPSNSGYIST